MTKNVEKLEKVGKCGKKWRKVARCGYMGEIVGKVRKSGNSG